MFMKHQCKLAKHEELEDVGMYSQLPPYQIIMRLRPWVRGRECGKVRIVLFQSIGNISFHALATVRSIGNLFLHNYRFLIQWTRVNNIIVSIFGIVATIMALLIMSDWQATLHDTCLDFSLYHNPHFGSTDASHVMPPTQHCWSTKNLSGAQPDYHITGMDHGHLELVFKLNNNQEFQRRLVCDVFQSGVGCNACEANKTFKADLSVDRDGQDFCLERSATIAKHDHEMRELIIKCHAKSNESCDIVCLYLYNSNNPQAANLQEFEYKSPAIKSVYKSLLEDVYIQSLTVVDNNKYIAAMEQCEAHTEEQCHWIPNSIITKQHCGDCEPICRSLRHSLNFIQFSIGAFWFMFSMPVAEVSLPLVISDSVREQFQVCTHIHT